MTEPTMTPTTVVMNAEQIAAMPPELAASRRDAIRSDPKSPFNNLMNRFHEDSIDEMLALTARANPAPPPTQDERELGLRVPRPATPEPEPTPEPNVYDLPQLAAGLEWPETPTIKAFQEVAARDGWAVLPTLNAFAHATWNEGLNPRKPMTQEECGERLVELYGEAEAERLTADAQAWGATMPESVKAWVKASGADTNPYMLAWVAKAWRNRRQGPVK